MDIETNNIDAIVTPATTARELLLQVCKDNWGYVQFIAEAKNDVRLSFVQTRTIIIPATEAKKLLNELLGHIGEKVS